jgi:hypothetical protein
MKRFIWNHLNMTALTLFCVVGVGITELVK